MFPALCLLPGLSASFISHFISVYIQRKSTNPGQFWKVGFELHTDKKFLPEQKVRSLALDGGGIQRIPMPLESTRKGNLDVCQFEVR